MNQYHVILETLPAFQHNPEKLLGYLRTLGNGPDEFIWFVVDFCDHSFNLFRSYGWNDRPLLELNFGYLCDSFGVGGKWLGCAPKRIHTYGVDHRAFGGKPSGSISRGHNFIQSGTKRVTRGGNNGHR